MDDDGEQKDLRHLASECVDVDLTITSPLQTTMAAQADSTLNSSTTTPMPTTMPW
jgi:hypothetical protein